MDTAVTLTTNGVNVKDVVYIDQHGVGGAFE